MARERRAPAVARVLQRVTATVREHDMFRPGDLVLASVSGGPDSVCLLYSLWYLRRLLRIKLAVFHFDHKLRPDSARDGEYVRRLSTRLRLPFHLVEAATMPRRGQSVEAWGHDERFKARLAVAMDIDARRIAVAHTLDDQAESVLMAAITGAGRPERLAGLPPAEGPIVRPLLEVPREDVEAFCRALRLRPRLDPMNDENGLLRNSIRGKVIPVLERELGRGIRTSLARTGAIVGRDAYELSRQAEPYIADWLRDAARAGTARLPARKLSQLARPIAGRVAWAALVEVGGRSTDKDAEALLDLARGRAGRRVDLSAGLEAWRDREYVHVSRPPAENTRAEGAKR